MGEGALTTSTAATAIGLIAQLTAQLAINPFPAITGQFSVMTGTLLSVLIHVNVMLN